MDYKRLGKRIREERLKLNLTQVQFAETVDISDTYMEAIERGEQSLTLNHSCGLLTGLESRLIIFFLILYQTAIPIS